MSNKAQKRGLVPKLRFPEFRDAGEWETKQVGDVFKVTRGEVLSMTLVQDEKTNEACYPVYSSQTKNNGLSGYYSDFLYEDAITWTTDGANAGDVNYRSGKFYCTNVCGVLINTDGHANPCIAALINSVSRSHVSYVGNPKLMNGVMSKIVVPFPSVKEQQKISDCLASLDERITLEAQKLDTLKTQKKGLMQQLFPAEGETLPKLRFPEFREAGEWEEKTLGKICNSISSGKDTNDLEGHLDLYGSTGVIGKTSKASFNGIYILVARVGANAGFTNKANGIFGVTDNTLVIDLQRSEQVAFVFYWLDVIGLNKLIFGSGQPLITGTQLKDLVLFFPSYKEQQKIADCLTSLDDLITAQTQKLAALKTHKKGLMQQLFPTIPNEREVAHGPV